MVDGEVERRENLRKKKSHLIFEHFYTLNGELLVYFLRLAATLLGILLSFQFFRPVQFDNQPMLLSARHMTCWLHPGRKAIP